MKKSEETKQRILSKTQHLVATQGCYGISMRTLANQIPISQSVLYHYFKDKDELLKEMYLLTNRQLGELRAALPPQESTANKLKQIIHFQFEHAEKIVAVLKYYLYKREEFYQENGGSLPEKAILHIEEVLEYGISHREIRLTNDLSTEAKVIAHAINGYLLEYYPHMPEGNQADQLVEAMATFILRSISSEEVHRSNKQKESYAF